jgi:Type IV secretion system pilin
MSQTVRSFVIKFLIVILSVLWGVVSLLQPTLLASAQTPVLTPNPKVDTNKVEDLVDACTTFGQSNCIGGVGEDNGEILNTAGVGCKPAFPNSTAGQKIQGFIICRVVDPISFVAGALAVLAIVWGGVTMILNQGREAFESGLKIVQNSAIGLVVIVLAAVIVRLIVAFLIVLRG